jgi:virginiamycin B lyase
LLAGTPAPAQKIREFPVPTAGAGVLNITRGPDGNVWFTERLAGKIGRMTPAGVISEFVTSSPTTYPDVIMSYAGNLVFLENGTYMATCTPAGFVKESTDGYVVSSTSMTLGIDGRIWMTSSSQYLAPLRVLANGPQSNFYAAPGYLSDPRSVVSGPDGRIWFARPNSTKLGVMSVDDETGTIQTIDVKVPPRFVTGGPDGNLWVTSAPGTILKVSVQGTVLDSWTLPGEPGVGAITTGWDGAVWFTEEDASKVGRLDPRTRKITEYATPTPNALPKSLAFGADGALYVTEQNANAIGRLTLAGDVNGSGAVDVSDVFYLINYLFGGGPAPHF